jgi:hypothetical protein
MVLTCTWIYGIQIKLNLIELNGQFMNANFRCFVFNEKCSTCALKYVARHVKCPLLLFDFNHSEVLELLHAGRRMFYNFFLGTPQKRAAICMLPPKPIGKAYVQIFVILFLGSLKSFHANG